MVTYGHRVTIVSRRSAQTMVSADIKQLALPEGHHGALSSLYQMYRILRSSRAQVYHVHYAKGYLPSLAYIAGCRPLVVSTMGGDVLLAERSPLPWTERFLIGLLLRRADIVTAKSEHMISAIARMRVPQHRIMKVVWGVDTKTFYRRPDKSLRKRLNLSLATPILLSSRSLKPFYNIDLIVNSFAVIRNHYPDAHLLIAEGSADTDYKTEISALIKRLGLDDCVHFIGTVAHDEMPEVYAAADVVLSAAPSDGLPQSLLEAMACGKPTVLTDLSSYREVADVGCGYVPAALTVDHFARAACSLLADETYRRNVGEAGEVLIRSHYDLYREAERVSVAYGHLALGRRSAILDLAYRAVAAVLLLSIAIRPFPGLLWKKMHLRSA